MTIVKIVELIGVSESSIDDALQNVVEEASRTMKNIDSVNVENIKVHVKDGKISTYGVNCKLSFRIERGDNSDGPR
ncbi:dodecin family protein [Lunatibacter salilacus]|uniref:dodecin family protein n=1 Tax=Lunatibacter salilacus TaxID=2483804 RepID=UPI00131E1644|nr:dodecin family protein [Lunatibacter salilacus]